MKPNGNKAKISQNAGHRLFSFRDQTPDYTPFLLLCQQPEQSSDHISYSRHTAGTGEQRCQLPFCYVGGRSGAAALRRVAFRFRGRAFT